MCAQGRFRDSSGEKYEGGREMIKKGRLKVEVRHLALPHPLVFLTPTWISSIMVRSTIES